MDDFVGYVGDPDIHDGTILSVTQDGTQTVVTTK